MAKKIVLQTIYFSEIPVIAYPLHLILPIMIQTRQSERSLLCLRPRITAAPPALQTQRPAPAPRLPPTPITSAGRRHQPR